MFKTKKAALILAIVLVLSLIATSCGGNTGSSATPTPSAATGTDNTGDTATTDTGTDDQTAEPKKLDNYDITFFRPGMDMNNKEDGFVKAIEKYEADTGGKVNVIIVDWSAWKNKLLAMYAAGEPIDVLFGGSFCFEQMYWYNYFQPLNSYMDLSSNLYSQENMKTFTRDGNTYIASLPESESYWLMYYNKSKLEAEGIKTPGEYYEEGNWTYDTFADVCRQFARDTSGDGNFDQWGIVTWQTRIMPYANASSFVTLKDGKLVENLNDPKFQTGVQQLIDAQTKEGWFRHDYGENEFLNQQSVIWLERPFQSRNLEDKAAAGEIDFEWGVVPVFYGPDNTEKLNLVEADGFGIGTGAKNPEAAAVFLDTWAKLGEERREANERPLRDDLKQLISEMSKNTTSPFIYDGILDEGDYIINQVYGEMISTSNITATADKYRSKMQESLDAFAKGRVEAIIRDFTWTGPIDFEDGTYDAMKAFDNKENTTIEIVEGDEAIDGKSLKVTMPAADGEWNTAISTNGDVISIPGWRTYKLSFDYKLLGDHDASGYIFVAVKSGSAGDLTWHTIPYANIGEKQTFEVTYDALTTNAEDLVVSIGGHKPNGSIVIDNFNLVEVKK